MKSLLLLLIVCVSLQSLSQTTKSWKSNNDIPKWALKVFYDRELDKNYAITYKLYPSFLTGDFNGDKRKDVAFFVQEISTKKTGIAIIHGKSVQAMRYQLSILGAGEKLNKLGDDFNEIRVWSFAKRSVHSWNTMAVNYDAIRLQRADSTQGLISWDGKEYSWNPSKVK